MNKHKEDTLDLGPFMQKYVLNSTASSFVLTPPAPEEKKRSTRRAPGVEDRLQAQRGGTPSISSTSGQTSSQTSGQLSSRPAQNSANADIKDWISNHYRFLPGYGGASRLNSLLGEAKIFFPQLTAAGLTKILKSSFPDCHKIPDKEGAYYQGLVKRPELPYYDDANLVSAVGDIMCGKINLEHAMASYAIEEAKIIQMIMWAPNDSPFGDTSEVISQLYPVHMTGNKNSKMVTRLKVKESEDMESNNSGDTSSKTSSEGSKKQRVSSGGRHKSKRKKRRASKDGELTPLEDQQKKKKKKKEDGYEGGSDDTSQDSAFCGSNGSDKSSSSGSSDDEKKKAERNKENMELKEKIRQLHEKLSHEENANEWLRTEVTRTRQQTESLRAELSRRDCEYASLAEKLLALNTEFQKIAQQLENNSTGYDYK